MSGGRGRAADHSGRLGIVSRPSQGRVARRPPSVRPAVGELRRVRPAPAARASLVLRTPPGSLLPCEALLRMAGTPASAERNSGLARRAGGTLAPCTFHPDPSS